MRKLFLLIPFLLVFGGAMAQVPQYTYTSSGGTCQDNVPFNWSGYKTQHLYFPDDFVAPALPAQPGFVTALYFKANPGFTSGTWNDFKVSIGNTAITTFPSTWQTGLTVGYGPATYTAGPVTANGWFKIPFTTPVYIDASQQFIIEVTSVSNSISGNAWVVACGPHKNPARSGTFNRLWNTAGAGTPNMNTTYLYDLGIDFFAGYPCTGTPTSNVSAPDLVCLGKPFKVMLETFYADATYEWEYSDDGTTWKKYLGTLGLMGDFTETITAARWYRCKITCINTGFTYTTPVKKVDIAPFYYCYCDNGAAATTGLDIGNVKVIALTTDEKDKGDTVLNNGVLTTPPNPNTTATNKYTSFQYSKPAIKIYRDSVYAFHVSQISSKATMEEGHMTIFIDLNRNGVFDATDRVTSKTINTLSLVANTESDTFRIPSTAQIGLTGMRVILSNGPIDSCGTFPEGETEDYLVDMRYEPCNGPQSPGIVQSTDVSMCPGYDYLVMDTTYEKKKSDVTRFWQVSGDNITWTGITGSTNQDVLSKVFTGQPLYYRVRSVCEATQDTTYSPELKIDAKDGYKCYCYSQAIGGNADSSDIGGVSIGSYTAVTGGPHLLNTDAFKKRSDYTENTPYELFIDSTYNMYVYHTLRSAEHGDAKITIFMDFNNNKQYDVPYERLFTGYTSVGNFTLVDKVTIPKNVITNLPTGMRVVLNNNLTPNTESDDGCGGYTSGETEDFMVIFRKAFPTGIAAMGEDVAFNMFPNPTSGKFTLQLNTAKDVNELQMIITNVTGQQVMQQSYSKLGRAFNHEVDMSNTPRGVYFVELNVDGEKYKQKLTVK